MRLILASGSPRRKELLGKLGIPFEVKPSNFEEDMSQNLPPEELVKKLSYGKAMDIAKGEKDAIVIGADTIVYFEGKVLGKPKTEEKATQMLNDLNGKSHSVFTGYTLVNTNSGKVLSKSVETKVFFKKVSEKEIKDYVATGEPLDKAGAYAVQEKGSFLLDHIEGDYDNVVGLPIASLQVSLSHFLPKESVRTV